MDAKQILGISVLAVAGAVSAQTVPQEQWVVAPFPATGSLSRASVMADSFGALRTAQAPQEFRIGPPDARAGTMGRAEVVADLRNWIGSGQGQFASGEYYDAPYYRPRRVAMYQGLREAPALPVASATQDPGAAAAGARLEDGPQTQ